jgi:hypothetical protein
MASEDAGVPRVLNYIVFTMYGAGSCLKLFSDDSEMIVMSGLGFILLR